MNPRETLSIYAFILGLLTFLFFLRVLAQALVAFFDIPFLPPMKAWYDPTLPIGISGLIPYPILLPLQAVILLFQAKISMDFSRRGGFFVVPRKSMGRFLCWISYFYFALMALRYALSMALFPERRWFGQTAIIFFHFVLAGFLFTLGHFHARQAPASAMLNHSSHKG
ncbi:MAG: hypothetical protein ACREQA_08190 [Candidatus Binatia bacterium]